MSRHPKGTSKYHFGPVDGLGMVSEAGDGFSAAPGASGVRNDASVSRRATRNAPTPGRGRIGELDEDIEGAIMSGIAVEQSQGSERAGKRARMASSDDGTVFWKASPRQKRVRQVCSSPSKVDDDSLLNDESITDLFQTDLSPEKFRRPTGGNSAKLQPNNLNHSILQSLKVMNETKSDDGTGAEAILDSNFTTLLHQIGTSMLSPEQAHSMSTTTDSFQEIKVSKQETVESDEFSDDGDNDNLILQLTQRPIERETSTGISKDSQNDVFSDDIEDHRSAIRTTTNVTEVETAADETPALNILLDDDDSFSDDDEVPIVSKLNSFKLGNSDENLAKCAIEHPSLHRLQIKEITTAQYKTNNVLREQKILKCLTGEDTLTTVIVRDFWTELLMQPLDVIHIVTDVPGGNFKLVDKDRNLLIWHPDELVSPTKIGSATYCVRESVINDKFKGPGVVSEAFVIGNITHSLFQSCLRHKKCDDAYINTFLDEQLDANVFNIYSVESTRAQIKETLLNNALYIKSWIQTYVQSAAKQDFKVAKILDIEENIMSPMFGLRGFIDVVIEAALPEGTFVVPMEIKSGKEYLSNKAQVAMYTLLIKDRYHIDTKVTDLVYTKMKTNHLDNIKISDLKHLIQLRNSLSQFMVYGQTELPPLKQRSSCERCFSLEPCMTLNKLAEDGRAENSGIDVDMYSSFTDHIDNPVHSEFFKHWNDLITMEEGYLKFSKADLWKQTSKERESNGAACIGGLRLVNCEYSSVVCQYVYEFKRPLSGSQSKIGKFDPIILSEDGGSRIGIAEGVVNYIDSECIIVSSKRRWVDSAAEAAGFDAKNKQFFKSVLTNGPIVISSTLASKNFRVDKNVFAMGLSSARWNLLNLFLPAGDTKRRELIVELREPRFKKPMWTTNFSGFNQEQCNALNMVSKAEDYSLILGMPGTGKTTVISHMIRAIIESGKSVLITSYTHSAVDNICEKLIDIIGPDISLLRLGAAHKVHEKVLPYTLYADQFKGDLSTKELYSDVVETRQIVAATCLGVNDGIFGRMFDYCIVDEASQVPLPVVLGPLQYAERFVLVGDHYQLPPLVVNPEARAGGLDKSLFQLLNNAYPEHVVELTNQYRMNADIMAISNDLVYGGRLKCGTTEVANRQLDVASPPGCPEWVQEVLKPERRVTFVDYEGMDGVGETRNGDQIENPGECELISEVVEAMVEGGVEQKNIGLMSFYNGQLQRFRRTLPSHLTEEIEMLTADKFQGRDKDVILISLVRTEGIGSLLKELRRVNVAMTRAKRKLVVFGHSGLIRDKVPSMMEAFDSRGWIVKPGKVDIVHSQRPAGRIRSQVGMKPKGDILSAVLAEME